MTGSGIPVVWSAPMLDRSGYAEEARQYVLALGARGVDVRADPFYRHPWVARLSSGAAEQLERLVISAPPERYVSIVHGLPMDMHRLPQATRSIARTLFETRGPLPLMQLATMDEIWVASDFNLESFVAAGVDRRKLRKVPQTLSVDLYTAPSPPLEIPVPNGCFSFLSMFVWQLRKGWDVLLHAYLEEFGSDDPVVLLLKVDHDLSLTETTIDIQRRIDEFIAEKLGSAPHAPIVLFDLDLTDEQLPQLYRAVDAFVLATRGEGWGRPYMEAMASGLPTIGTRATGQLEFMNDDNSYLIDCVDADVPEHAWPEVPHYAGHRWVDPSIAHLRQQMRRVFEERGESAQRGEAAREAVLSSYGWDSVARTVADLLGFDVAAEKPPRPGGDRPRVAWRGDLFSDRHEAIIGRGLCRAVLGSGRIDLTPVVDETEDALERRPSHAALARRARVEWIGADVVVAEPSEAAAATRGGGRVVVFDAAADGVADPRALDALDRGARELWVSSEGTRSRYLAAGARSDQVITVPPAIDHLVFTPAATPLALPTTKSTKFLVVGGARFAAGTDIAVEAYLEAFSAMDDVSLVVRDTPDDSARALMDSLGQLGLAGDHPEILFLTDELPHEMMPGLYAACDALVHPRRSDGSGRVALEAMACGLPVIVPDVELYRHLRPAGTAYMVPVRLVVPNPRGRGPSGTVAPVPWAESDRHQLAAVMREVALDPAAAADRGRRASAILDDLRWEDSAQLVVRRIHAVAAADTQAPVVSSTSRLKLTVCLMVLNEEHALAAAIESVEGVADQVVVVDVGSTDRTVEIAERLGAEVHRFGDPDDFGAGRTECLRHADGDWILVLDADERLDPASHVELRGIVESDEQAGYKVRIVNYLDREGTERVLEHSTLRLFPNHADLHYVGRDPHAQLSSRTAEGNLDLRPCGVTLHHDGYRPQVMENTAKLERNRRALEQAVVDEPANAFHAFNLGLTYSLLGRAEDAEHHLLRSIGLSAVQLRQETSHGVLPNAYVSLAAAVFHQHRFAEAVAYSEAALRLVPDFGDAYLMLGTALSQLGRGDEALAAYRTAMSVRVDSADAATDRATSTWKPLVGMADVFAARGQLDAAARCLADAYEITPENPDLAVAVARLSLARGEVEAAEAILEVLLEGDDAPPEAWVTRAEIELERDRPDAAARIVEGARALHPSHQAIFDELAADVARRSADD